jgi:hypothetical protein
MKLINKLTGRESTQPQDMKKSQIVDIQKICDNLKLWIGNSIRFLKKSLVETQTNIYCFYVEFSTQELEDEYLLLETIPEKQAFLDANEGLYTETRGLHPNVKLLYTYPEEQDQIIDFVQKKEAFLEAESNLPDDFYRAIDRLDSL